MSDTKRAIWQNIVSIAQAQVTVLLVWHLVMTSLLVIASLVPNYARVTPVGALAVPHTIWAVAGLLVFLVGAESLYLGVRFDMRRQATCMRILVGVVVLDLAAQLVHACFGILELAYCVTDLCLNVESSLGYGVLIATVVMLLVDGLLVYCSLRFLRARDYALADGWFPGYWQQPQTAPVANSMWRKRMA